MPGGGAAWSIMPHGCRLKGAVHPAAVLSLCRRRGALHAALEACCSLLPVRRRQAMAVLLTAHLPGGLLWLGCLLLPRLPLAFSASCLRAKRREGKARRWEGA